MRIISREETDTGSRSVVEMTPAGAKNLREALEDAKRHDGRRTGEK